ncbi:MAG: PorT family protein [Bacteroidetes bacterium]|nr:PorT family protein [Bacteroidota bacterium]
MKHYQVPIILFLFLIFFLRCDLIAQRFDGGILAGGLISQVDGDRWGGYTKVGFLGGGFVHLELSPHSSLQLEMEYIQKGSKKPTFYQENDYHSYLLRLHYLEIPILYQFTFLKRISVEAGPAVDVLLGFNEEVDGSEVPNDYPFRRVTLAGIVGVSGYISRHLKATFRFNYSLFSLRQPQPDRRPEAWRKVLFDWGQYNNVLSLSVSYQFKGRRNW